MPPPASSGASSGAAYITVTTHNGKTARVKVTVKKAPKKVSLAASRASIGLDETIRLTPRTDSGTASRTFTYATSNANILRVNADNSITAVGLGSATITVRTYNGKKGSRKITVTPKPEYVNPNPASLLLGFGQTAKLGYTLSPGTAGGVTFKNDNSGLLEVDPSTGTIKALSEEGTAYVTLETYNGKTNSCKVEIVPAPSQVAFAQTSITLGLRETAKVPDVILGVQTEAEQEKCAASYTFKSSKKKIVAVNAATGVIKGLKRGTAYITVTTHNGKSARVKVTVLKSPTKVAVSAPHTVIGIGEKMPLSARTNSGTASRTFTYTTSNANVVDVDPNTGVVTGISTDTATIRARAYNGKSSTIKLTVKLAPTGVELEDLTLGKGETSKVAVKYLPNGSGGGLTYSIKDTSVATINTATGAVKGVSVGTTEAYVETYNGFKASCTVTVKEPPTGIQLQDGSFTLAVGDKYQLNPPIVLGANSASATITYKTANAKYAKISSTGEVTAVKAGTVKIGAFTYNGKSSIINVTVKAAPKSIAFSESTHRLFIGTEFTPTVKFANGVPGTYSLESSDPSIAEIDGTTVRGISSGTVTITATSYNKKTATMTVWVPELPTRVDLEPETLIIGEGDSGTLRAVMPEGQGAALEYDSLNPDIASCDIVDNETITVNGLAKGTATIHVISKNSKENTATVKVLKAPTAVSVSPNRARRSIEEKQLQLTVGFGGEGEGGRVTFTSSNTAVATVSDTGLVRFGTVGTARITVTTYNGHSATCELTIGEKPGAMFFDQTEYAVALGDTVLLPASFDKGCESYTFTSSDDSIVEIKGEMVRGLKLGKATLTAKSYSGLTATCTVQVVPEPEGISLDVTQAELVIGKNSTLQLHASPLPHGAGSVHYSSSAPDVATVDYSTGLITARERGDCVIYATTYNGHTAECKIHVSYLLEGVKIGIDPGHQQNANTSKESVSPKGGGSKYKVSHGTSGVSTHIAEFRTNLTVGLKLRDALEKLGAEVYMTRETHNVNISNQQRAKMMNNYGVDVVLRLHCNGSSNRSANGVNLYIRKTCAYSSSVVNGSALLANESRAANSVIKYFVQATGAKNGGVRKNDTYTMNNWSTVPCLLVEMGYMSNSAEDKKLNNAAYQTKMVQGMVRGICEYMGRDLPTEW